MPRISRVFAGVVLPVAVVAAVGGCSSSDDSSSPNAGASGAPAASVSASTAASASASAGSTGSKDDDAGGVHGRLDYTGSVSGGFDVTGSVGCAVFEGKFTALTAPDPSDTSAPAQPAFTTTVGDESMATLITPDKKTFVKLGAAGVSAAKHNGVWTVTLKGTELGATDASGGSVTVTGHIDCTKTSGT